MSLIYEPKGAAREYAALACNMYANCEGRCAYCFAPGALHRTREDFHGAVTPRMGGDGSAFLSALEREAARKQVAGATGRVLLCFVCDPYPRIEEGLRLTRRTIEILHTHGFTVSVLSKMGNRATLDFDLFGPGDAFAQTLTFIDREWSENWEPGAALPFERMLALRTAHERGIETWASMEPIIDPRQTAMLIRETAGYVNHYKVGKINHSKYYGDVDWAACTREVVGLLRELGKSYYIKESLAAYVPAGTPREA